MKRIYIILTLSLLTLRGVCQPVIISPSFPGSVDLFDLFEVSFTLGDSYVNPYDPDTIDIYALFIAPDNTTFKVNAFYYEDYFFQQHSDGYEVAEHNASLDGWRIRFTPNQVGNWKFRIMAVDANGVSQMPNDGAKNYYFVCESVLNADGFITVANSRYLQREVVRNGRKMFRSFFPVGPDVAWYNNKGYDPEKPLGIYQYKRYIDSLYNNCNYMRIFLNRCQYLSLYGSEYTQIENGLPKVYFDSIINQKDSAELDYIVSYAKGHGIAIMPSIFTCENFELNDDGMKSEQNKWPNNPFNTILHLSSPCCFFTDADAKRITRNLVRYVVSRWGYATNIMSWEFWNEVTHVLDKDSNCGNIEDDVVDWHVEMVDCVHGNDPFRHCVSTSMGSNVEDYSSLYSSLFDILDFAQAHRYEYIQNAASRRQISFRLYLRTIQGHTLCPSKPFFQGEFGFDQNDTVPKNEDKDPHGIDLHNSLWSSLFSTSMGPASFWWWPYVDTCALYHRFAPLLYFCQRLPVLSDSFTPHQTGRVVSNILVFPNNLETYYMINDTESSIYGWSQDTAFAYQSLRRLTDSVRIEMDSIMVIDPSNQDTTYKRVADYYFVDSVVFDPDGYVYTLDPAKRPAPSSNDNTITIPITNQAVGTLYRIQWYNSETGISYGSIQSIYVQQDTSGNKFLSFGFPSFIRDVQHQVVNNTFGDAVFSIHKYTIPTD
ncbi:MAG: DUF5060 domain-containing protein [Bacteroidales bacterium]|nr:DUF5060 domain-containing protein [Bacteroidales bacterium]MBQ6771029.1 DUF5060 domain-containing protein [Bacteroidales bacterium]